MFLQAATKRGLSPEKAGDVYLAIQALSRRLRARQARAQVRAVVREAVRS